MKRYNQFINKSLRESFENLQRILIEKGYSKDTIRNYRVRLRPIQTYMMERHIKKYTRKVGNDYFKYYLSTHNPGKILRTEIHASINRLNDACNNSNYILSHTIPQKHEIPNCFLKITNLFLKDSKIHGNSDKTINRKKLALSVFLQRCKKCGIEKIESITPKCIETCSRNVKDIDQWNVLKLFFEFLFLAGVTKYNLSIYVPKGKRTKKIPSTYTTDEINKIEQSINRNTIQGKRDYCIVLLASRLGLRASDISNLKYSNLDFDNDRITFFQIKTKNEISLKMIPQLKNAFREYLTKVDNLNEYVFKTLDAPKRKISSQDLYGITNKYFQLAKINTSNKKHGTHSFRTSLATSMVNDNISYDIVRNILGHTSENAIQSYAKIDIDNLRRCSIPVPTPCGEFYDFIKEQNYGI